MSDPRTEGLTRREVIAAGIGAAVGGSAISCAPASSGEATARGTTRMPTVFVPHGGGPWPWIDGMFPAAESAALAGYLRSLPGVPRTPPTALLVVSAHWEERVPTVMTAAAPPMLYDYHGFPPETYQLQWPAPGAPELAARIQALLAKAGIASAADADRGFDHGTFVPLMLAYPEAKIPTVQLSLQAGLDPAAHLALGRAIAPLRDEGVFIIGSGMSYHNMPGFRDPRAATPAQQFDTWLREAATAEPAARTAALTAWAAAPAARDVHPREEHLLPLLVIAGAAGDDRGTAAFSGTQGGKLVSAFHFG